MKIRQDTRTESVRRFPFAVALLLSAAFNLAAVRAIAQQPVSITVSAAISLKDAMDELDTKYQQAHPGVSIHFNYGASGTLQHQIEQGAPIDVFFSAAERQMDDLSSEGLIDSATRRDVVANTLVLIAPVNSQLVKSFEDLGKPDVKIIAVGEPSAVPAGLYAQQTLSHLGLTSTVQKKLVLAKDVRQVLTYVETGNADAGLVYATDAKISSKVQVVATAPASSHGPILYPAAVLKDSKQPAAAREFLNYVCAPDARGVFAKFGFAAPEK